MAELNVEINGNASGLNNAINQSTANLNTFSRSGTRSIQSLQIQMQSFQRIAARATDPAILADYNRRIQSTSQEITRLGNVGRTGFDAMGNAINRNTGALSSSFGLLRTVANILPGIGIAGLAGFAIGPLIEYAQNLEIIKGTAKEVATELAFKSTDYTKALSEVVSLKSGIADFHSGLITGKQLVNQYNEGIGRTAGQLTTVAQVEDFYNSKAKNYVTAMLLRAKANAALETAVKKLAEAQSRAEGKNSFLDYVKASGDALTGLLTFRGNISKNFNEALDIFKKRDADELKKNADVAIKVYDDLQKASDAFNKKSGITLDGPKTPKDTGKSLADIRDSLNKALERTYVQANSTFGDQIKSQISAYQAAIDSATDAFGRQSQAVRELQKEQAKLFSGDNFNLNSGRATTGSSLIQPSVLPSIQTKTPTALRVNTGSSGKIGDDLGKELSRSLTRFGNDFYSTITNLGQANDEINKKYAEQLSNATTQHERDTINSYKRMEKSISNSFEGIATSLALSLQESVSGVFQNVLAKKLGSIIEKKFDDLDDNQQKLAIGLGLAGSLVSGNTKKTSGVGQGIGGALTGAAVGTVIAPGIGTLIGGAIGLIGGIFGAKKARKQEELQAKQLAESEKQTKLLERQNALTYTSSIIGAMTSRGIVTGVDRNEFGEIVTKISGQDILIIADRAAKSRKRGT